MWSSLQQLIRSKNDRCIIMENGEPKYVIVSFEEYQHLQKNEGKSIVNPERSATEGGVNGELEVPRESYNSPISLEDLPL